MIGADVNAARAITGDLLGLGDFNALGLDAASLCASLIETITDPHFPGAVVPSIGIDGNLQILVAASTMSEWRRLRPVLQAFAGPTLTSFDGLPEALPQGDPARRYRCSGASSVDRRDAPSVRSKEPTCSTPCVGPRP
jgi:hypothetical protein